MKKSIIALLTGGAAGILAGILAGSVFIGAHKAGGLYPQSFRVASVDYDADIVTLETSTGFLYQFGGVEDWQPGDYCGAIMDDRGTAEIMDDIIFSLRYTGF